MRITRKDPPIVPATPPFTLEILASTAKDKAILRAPFARMRIVPDAIARAGALVPYDVTVKELHDFMAAVNAELL